ncbi:sigma-E processing peptidase SpoIIGA [Papillibacter cinnamivorans]|uniref:Sporulation sigma-E factor-processing peptidase n=1 Tax=Papillibacter cinnamivorans DSM 12816 TaxID=1122930 RepID=A0A1W1YLB6_9FIRM|nr:sigma-E processing peptidase SpoIIGA [Papillibacter cinnamivorans]SMC36934.1 stage II sporulation protein GA (sporulation sigma-E factor processing peptidase) [Papillibacter cinnamivorans DSM 12816]
MTVIYIDTLFVLNFIVNYLLLLASAKVTGEAISRVRLVLAAAAGGAYAVAVFLPGLGFLTHPAVKVAAAALMVLIAFPFTRSLLRLSLVFFGVSFAFAGAVLAVGLILGSGGTERGVFYLPVELRVLLPAVAASYLLINLVFRRAARHGGKSRDLAPLSVRIGEKSAHLTALVDTGNTLADPVSNAPVIISELAPLRPILPPRVAAVLTEDGLRRPVDVMEALAQLGEAGRFRLIPYQAVGVECGLLLVFRADEITLGRETRKGGLVALSPTRLSDGGAWSALAGEPCRQ